MSTAPRRWLVGGLLAALLAWGVASVLRRLEPVDIEVRVDMSPEARRDPFYGAKAIARGIGGRVVAPDNLDALPPPGATLVLMSPHWNLLPGREAGLRRWVEAGGHLVIPDATWMPASLLASWMQIEVGRGSGSTPSADARPARRRRADASAATDDASCRNRVLEEPPVPEPFYGQRRVRLCVVLADARLLARADAVWRLDDNGYTRMQRVKVGAGRVSASTVGQVFTGTDILRADHALAWAALLALHPGDQVWFVTDEARTPLLAALWLHAWPGIALAALALSLLLWRRGARFGPLEAEPEPARRSIGEQVRRTAAFIAAGGGDALLGAARLALDATARRRLSGYDTMTDDARVAAIARAAQGDRARLAEAMAPSRRGFARALAELETTRRALASRPRGIAAHSLHDTTPTP